MKIRFHTYKWWSCISILHWMISFFTDRLIFSITAEKIGFYMLMKVLFLILLNGMWIKVADTIRKCMEGNAVTIQRLIYGCSYAMILFLTLFIIWPGIWRTDEFGVLGNVIVLQIYWWQHLLTSLFYIFSMMLIPNPVGVIIVQVVLVSIGFGYLAELLEQKFRRKWTGYLLLIPFCIPSVVMFQLYPMRITLYAILELVMLFFLYDHIVRAEKINDIQMIFLALGTGILANWRSEGIYYVIVLPLFAGIVLYKKMISRKQYFCYLLIVLASTGLIGTIQREGIHKERNDAYEITAYAQALPCLVRAAYEDHDEEGLYIVDKVIDVEAVLQAQEEGKEGIDSFWAGDMSSKEYTAEEFNEFRKQYYIWAIRYAGEFLGERTHNFLTSYEQTKNTENLYDDTNIQFVFFLQTFQHVEPFFPALREKVVLFMEKHCWCIFEIPMVIMVLTALCCMRRHKQVGALICMILVRIPLIYLTAPDNFFMYYYPFLLSGSVIGCFAVAALFQKSKKYISF